MWNKLSQSKEHKHLLSQLEELKAKNKYLVKEHNKLQKQYQECKDVIEASRQIYSYDGENFDESLSTFSADQIGIIKALISSVKTDVFKKGMAMASDVTHMNVINGACIALSNVYEQLSSTQSQKKTIKRSPLTGKRIEEQS